MQRHSIPVYIGCDLPTFKFAAGSEAIASCCCILDSPVASARNLKATSEQQEALTICI